MTTFSKLRKQLASMFPSITATQGDEICILTDEDADFRTEIPLDEIRSLVELEGIFDDYTGMRTAIDYCDGRLLIHLHGRYGILDRRKSVRLQFFDSIQSALVAHPCDVNTAVNYFVP